MLPPEYLASAPDSVIGLVNQVEEDILCDMARRIVQTGQLTATAQWQAWRLEQLGASRQYIYYHLQRLTGKTQGEINALFQEAGQQALYYDDQIYQAAGLTPGNPNDSPALLNLLNAGAQQTNGPFENLPATTANTASQQFERALDRAWLQLASGAFSYQTVIQQAIKDLARQGLQAIVYPSGHVDTLEVATRRAIMTGLNQTAAKLSLSRADEMDCDLVEVTAHHGARPSHQVWQCNVYSRSGKSAKYPDFVSSTGYGSGPGLCGWNCRHNFFPFFEGLSRSAYPEDVLRRYENQTVTYNGEKLSYYDATQKQRYLERQVRRWKREYLMLDAAGQDTTKAATKLNAWRRSLDDFLKQTGLDRQSSREMVNGFGRSQASKAVWTVKKYETISASLKSVTTSTGVSISDVSTHVVERCNQRQIAAESIVDALTNPLKTNKIRADHSQQFVGESATVVINTATGKVVTVWPTSQSRAQSLKRKKENGS